MCCGAFSLIIRFCCCCFSGVSSGAGMVLKHAVKLSYGLLLFWFCAILFLMLFWGKHILTFAENWIDCPIHGENTESCLGVSLVFRLSFVFTVFHLQILLSCLTRDSFSKFVNEGCWVIKMSLIGVAWFGTLFIPNRFFIVYAWFTDYGGFVFLLFQSISLIDFFYIWAEYWAWKFDEGNKCYGVLLIVAAVIMYVFGGYILWTEFTAFWGCGSSKIWLQINSILGILWTVMVVLKVHPTASIITSGAVTLLITYLGWISMISNPDDTCNKHLYDRGYMVLQIAGSFTLSQVCTVYHALIAAQSVAFNQARLRNVNDNTKSQEEQLRNTVGQNQEKPEDWDEKIGEEPVNENQTNATINVRNDGIDRTSPQWKQREYKTNHYIWFHAFMVQNSIYICSIFTNWGYSNVGDCDNIWKYNGADNNRAMWMKYANALVFALIYTWTLIAPRICGHRDFKKEEMEF